ncbi:hypothetical protein ACQ4M3_13225 [Leptolyngbya sp. AN03gr2]|uniref:ATP-dependent DNA ligase n=1 Tax=unclassified Leptolyngbya TaxID=2650499 RepID=UPI003D31C9A7
MRDLHTHGIAGANQYINDYGKGIGVEKVILLARQAEAEGASAMALGFWAIAYELEQGVRPDLSLAEDTASPTQHSATLPVNRPTIAELPDDLQPGRIQTMQPVDTDRPNTAYAEDHRFWGQPKRDGHRLVVIATPDGVYYQSKSTELKRAPTVEMNEHLLQVAQEIGTFVLDGELYYKSVIGSEHRTGSQASKINLKHNHPTAPSQTVYAIFKALYSHGKDYRPLAENDRIEAGKTIATRLQSGFEFLPTAKTTEEKHQLIATQQAENREGEIWIRYSQPYIGGKIKSSDSIVRTKYLQELEAIVTHLAPSRSTDRPFKSAVLAEQDASGNLIHIGSVGSGFDANQMQEIVQRHEANPGKVKIKVRFQNRTESGMLHHPRFIDLC